MASDLPAHDAPAHANRALVVVLYAKDAERVARFYEAALGLSRGRSSEEEEEEDGGAIVLGRGPTEIVVIAVPEAIAASIDVASPPELRAETPIKLSFLVDADAITSDAVLRAAIEAAGGGLKPATAAWSWRGAIHLDGWDPEGNVFQLRAPLGCARSQR